MGILLHKLARATEKAKSKMVVGNFQLGKRDKGETPKPVRMVFQIFS